MNFIAGKIFRFCLVCLSKEPFMTKTHVFAALPLALSLITPVTAKALHSQTSGPSAQSMIGREVAAPAWSAACTNDQGPTECGEPMWVYGSPAMVSRFKSAF
jgi:hypothetical protein